MNNNNTINFDETMPPGGNPSGRASLTAGDEFGQYRVVRLLGRGGMGEVYEVEHRVLRRRYALKLLPADFASRSDALARFEREAQVMANLEHPNIVQVDEFGETDGRYWLRMELANGHNGCVSLQDYADKHGGTVEPDMLAGIFEQVLDGLAHAHEHGVVHRDLKPANILIFEDKDGYASFKIADFGLVRMIGQEWLQSRTEQSVRLSMSVGGMETEVADAAGSSTRSLIGTHEYMSPEQKRGEDATVASDVYSVGLIMYRLLTGKQVGPRPPSYYVDGLDPAWDDLILTALEEDATKRFGDSASMRESLPMEGKTPSSCPAAPTETRRADTPTASDAASPANDPTAGNELGMEFVRVEPGTFLMGSEQAYAYDEKPVHEVTLTAPFWIGKYPVTQGEYETLIGWNPSYFQNENVVKPGFLGIGREVRRVSRPLSPVECVSWEDAVAFCEALTERERRAGRLPGGYVYRLPTEAEWEYAARGGTKSRHFTYAGSNNAEEVAWHDDNKWGGPHEVGQLKSNELGLYDMSGNVWEWCSDCYGEYPVGSAIDPTGPPADPRRVLRGGCWDNNAWACRSAIRFRAPLDFRYIFMSFRVCLAPQVLE